MKYTIKQTSEGPHVLMRYDEPAANPRPNNAELEFWFRIEELQIEVERLKNWIGKIGHEAGKETPLAIIEAMAEKAIKHSSCACQPEWGPNQDWAASGEWPPSLRVDLEKLAADPPTAITESRGKTMDQTTGEDHGSACIALLCGGGLVRDITVCHLPHHDAPFVHGWIATANGPRDVWLRSDGLWTSEEGDERNSLLLSDGWNPPKD